ncbi:SGNH/GDSL hydrolase family protein [Streptomyces sp. NPDC052101]|uniref:SGNH/GDSL hydrolase family protein n=1 Tax=Streptomyces sp. NPDC052101 TaxID=3155763 RepID=UPI0034167657
MNGRIGRGCRLAAALLTAVACQPAPARAAAPPPSAERASGVVTWAASAERLGEGTAGRGYRMIVHISAGGTGLRIRVTNAFGDRPLTLDSGYAGLRARGAALRPGSNRRLTFGGARTVTVPAGAAAWSDPLPGSWPAGTDLAVSLHTPGATGPATGHRLALQTSYTGKGDHTGEENARNWGRTTGSWWYLDAVSVRTTRTDSGAVVALGDSLTDGRRSTADRNHRWPDYLARRLTASGTDIKGVADEGISGNEVLADGAGQSALDRLDRDVLSQPGVRTVFLFEGVNDIKAHTGITAARLIAGYQEIARQVHRAGECLDVATVGPFKGWPEWDPAAESVRQQVNRFLRTSRDFDAVTDFDRVLRSPHHPERLLPSFDSGDHLHPDDKGMRALADAVDPDHLECAR